MGRKMTQCVSRFALTLISFSQASQNLIFLWIVRVEILSFSQRRLADRSSLSCYSPPLRQILRYHVLLVRFVRRLQRLLRLGWQRAYEVVGDLAGQDLIAVAGRLGAKILSKVSNVVRRYPTSVDLGQLAANQGVEGWRDTWLKARRERRRRIGVLEAVSADRNVLQLPIKGVARCLGRRDRRRRIDAAGRRAQFGDALADAASHASQRPAGHCAGSGRTWIEIASKPRAQAARHSALGHACGDWAAGHRRSRRA